MSYIDWDDIWIGLAFLTILVVVCIGVYGFFLAPHNVDYYYISNGQDARSGAPWCSYAHWTWHSDEKAFCDQDITKVQQFVVQANSTLPRK